MLGYLLVLLFVNGARAASIGTHCADFLQCRQELNALHLRCGESARNTTAEACRLRNEFDSLHSLLSRRSLVFAECVFREASDMDARAANPDAPQPPNIPPFCSSLSPPPSSSRKGCWGRLALKMRECEQRAMCCPAKRGCHFELVSHPTTPVVTKWRRRIQSRTLACKGDMAMVARSNMTSADIAFATSVMRANDEVLRNLVAMGGDEEELSSTSSDSLLHSRVIEKKKITAAIEKETEEIQKAIRDMLHSQSATARLSPADSPSARVSPGVRRLRIKHQQWGSTKRKAKKMGSKESSESLHSVDLQHSARRRAPSRWSSRHQPQFKSEPFSLQLASNAEIDSILASMKIVDEVATVHARTVPAPPAMFVPDSLDMPDHPETPFDKQFKRGQTRGKSIELSSLPTALDALSPEEERQEARFFEPVETTTPAQATPVRGETRPAHDEGKATEEEDRDQLDLAAALLTLLESSQAVSISHSELEKVEPVEATLTTKLLDLPSAVPVADTASVGETEGEKIQVEASRVQQPAIHMPKVSIVPHTGEREESALSANEIEVEVSTSGPVGVTRKKKKAGRKLRPHAWGNHEKESGLSLRRRRKQHKLRRKNSGQITKPTEKRELIVFDKATKEGKSLNLASSAPSNEELDKMERQKTMHHRVLPPLPGSVPRLILQKQNISRAMGNHEGTHLVAPLSPATLPSFSSSFSSSSSSSSSPLSADSRTTIALPEEEAADTAAVEDREDPPMQIAVAAARAHPLAEVAEENEVVSHSVDTLDAPPTYRIKSIGHNSMVISDSVSDMVVPADMFGGGRERKVNRKHSGDVMHPSPRTTLPPRDPSTPSMAPTSFAHPVLTTMMESGETESTTRVPESSTARLAARYKNTTKIRRPSTSTLATPLSSSADPLHGFIQHGRVKAEEGVLDIGDISSPLTTTEHVFKYHNENNEQDTSLDVLEHTDLPPPQQADIIFHYKGGRKETEKEEAAVDRASENIDTVQRDEEVKEVETTTQNVEATMLPTHPPSASPPLPINTGLRQIELQPVWREILSQESSQELVPIQVNEDLIPKATPSQPNADVPIKLLSALPKFSIRPHGAKGDEISSPSFSINPVAASSPTVEFLAMEPDFELVTPSKIERVESTQRSSKVPGSSENSDPHEHVAPTLSKAKKEGKKRKTVRIYRHYSKDPFHRELAEKREHVLLYPDEFAHLTACEFYTTCVEQLRWEDEKCAQETGVGRLLPGLPRRRLGDCNRKLVPRYQALDRMSRMLDDRYDQCVVERIFLGHYERMMNELPPVCHLPPPALVLTPPPSAPPPTSECHFRVAAIQAACAKQARCCPAAKECRATVDSSVLSRRLRKKRGRLQSDAAKCQIDSDLAYRLKNTIADGTTENLPL